MKPQVSRLLILLIAALCHSLAAQNDFLFSAMDEADLTADQLTSLTRLRDRATTTAARVVQVRDLAQLPSKTSLHLNLYDKLQFEALRTKTESWGADEFSWVGAYPEIGMAPVST